MNIAVLGTGMVGKAIAARLGQLDHNVFLGTRDVAKTLEAADEDNNINNWLSQNKNVELKSFAEAAAGAEMIFNCTKGMISLAALELAGKEHLAGKVLVDIANPLDFSNGMPPTLNPVNDDSLAEQIQAAYPDTKVVKTLNTMNAHIMVNPAMIPADHNVFVSGNDDEAKQAVKVILQSFGWKEELIIDLGDITTARGTEMLLPVWIRLWGALGTAEFNFHIQRK